MNSRIMVSETSHSAPATGRESRKARLERMHAEYAILCSTYPEPECALHFETPLQLLIATVLSAQTTDKRVNTVTPELFATYPSCSDLACANPEDVERIIRPLGFYRTKTKHGQCLPYSRLSGRHSCDARDRTVALAQRLAACQSQSSGHRTGDHRLFPSGAMDRPQSPSDSSRTHHLPRAQTGLRHMPTCGLVPFRTVAPWQPSQQPLRQP